ncbi:ribonucleotide reductase subunit alpha [Bowmanella dokdonensis]|uniref:Ribonucleotide reductase subunit alpha n=1 Tax=Bowmanella dokdonensis TaxID=751969 RepID=A0A939DM52_9ALTE|nr:ribonucleotide reductase subunit alpha [Bowmanella dokdonensis]MBN7824321.1 ribonucleotide reductase subunit alpha [Bowmanella dokdonensis]
MHITSYEDLIQVAKAQHEPQRLLFVFARAELPTGHTDKQKNAFEQGGGGALSPVLCVDKLPDEVGSFEALVEESLNTGEHWDIAFVSALSGRGGYAPNSDEATQPLHLMMKKIQSGMIGDFLTLTRDGELVNLQPG